MINEDRGQLLLVAGILLAVVFVALALLVNTAIYTDNVATRGGDSAGEALEYQGSAVDSIGGLLDAENANKSHADRTEIRAAIRGGSDEIAASMAENYLRRGATTAIGTDGITAANTTDGVLIQQNETGPIENWTVSDATGVRAFEITLDADSVGNESFNITLDSTAFFVYEDGNELVVARDTPDDVICRAESSGTVRFAVTDGRFGGEPCRFGWPTIDGDVAFENDGDVNGTYSITVAGDADPETFGNETDVTRAVYSIDALDLRIDTPQLRYETTVRVAPGEPNA